MTLDQAVNKAVNDCIKDGILADFLRANKSEVIGVSIFEFDRDEYDIMVREESEAKGRIEGIFKTLYELVRDNLLSLANAAKKAGQSEEEFTAGMSAYFAQGGNGVACTPARLPPFAHNPRAGVINDVAGNRGIPCSNAGGEEGGAEQTTSLETTGLKRVVLLESVRQRLLQQGRYRDSGVRKVRCFTQRNGKLSSIRVADAIREANAGVLALNKARLCGMLTA